MRLIFGIFIYGIQVRGFFCGFSCGFLCEGAENAREKALYGLLWLLWHELLLNTYCTGSFGTRCTDRNGNKVSSYPYEGAENNAFGVRCTDRNASKVPSYPYKRSVDSSYTT